MNPRTLLETHAEQCDECRAVPLPVESLAALLSSMDAPVEVSALSMRAMERLLQEVAIAAPAAWRRILMAMVKALLPLPLVLVVDAGVLRILYNVGNVFLPAAVAEYAVASYGAFLVLAFGMTYAAVPLLLLRQGARAGDWRAMPSKVPA